MLAEDFYLNLTLVSYQTRYGCATGKLTQRERERERERESERERERERVCCVY